MLLPTMSKVKVSFTQTLESVAITPPAFGAPEQGVAAVIFTL